MLRVRSQELRLRAIVIFATLICLIVITSNAPTAHAAPKQKEKEVRADEEDPQHKCGHTLFRKQGGFFKRHFDVPFWAKFFKHWVPFTSSKVKMDFFLYKRDFPDCGREIRTGDEESLKFSQFNADHPTRIIIHGWMSQSKTSFNRAVKNAYLSLAVPPPNITATQSEDEDENDSEEDNETTDGAPRNADTDADYDNTLPRKSNVTDFNVIVADWSALSSNVNYFGVVELIEDLGFLLADFVRYLHLNAGLNFNDVYLIGHSLGAQIAGSAGKQVYPFRFNTIFALDPAGPKFRDLPADQRIDPSDAIYVESIQTSSSFGFQEPVVGHATFYPNYGRSQKKCYRYGCSHSRSHDYFAESLTSRRGFWGTACERASENVWIFNDTDEQFIMGGEPSTPKNGTFFVKTYDKPPYAMGKRSVVEVEAF